MESSFIIKSLSGLHARPAAMLVQKANSFPCDISLVKGDKKVNAKSIMSILALGIEANEKIVVITQGEKEAEAMQAIGEFLET
ncbi:HPr family phosphocarrier protein [Desulfosporosinus fructosivorans]|uniref:Phosphocarrier protein HPr n=1 Tax=Desulfosporosinus fructosivorans TaxID=2018669 RepID=A0A4Z0RDN1_9FIRM|nr:HPr family phosphocarrier protein [Desulfosporosinus fructosivorans]TGE39636.1 HPr family phosphocarrier protein [Desulfosporosinus fructosivorans]